MKSVRKGKRGGARGKSLHVYSLVLTWHPVSEGNLTKLSRQLILNLTDVICFLRGQESADLSLFWSLLRLNYKHGMWAGQMMNSPAGEGGRNKELESGRSAPRLVTE